MTGNLTLRILVLVVWIGICQMTHAQSVLIASAEAENGTLSGNVTASNQATGYSGTGYVTNFSSSADKVMVTLSVPAKAYYKLVIRYRAPYGTKSEYVQLNGTTVSEPSFAETQSFTNLTIGEYLLNAGTTTVAVQSSWGWVDVDQFSLYSIPKNSYSIVSQPVNTLSTTATKSLYSFLTSVFNKMIISGQTNDYYNNTVQLTGKSPLVRTFDFASYTQGYPYAWNSQTGTFAFGAIDDGSVQNAINWYNTTGGKGIVGFHWHWCSPSGGQPGVNTFYTQNTTFDVSKAVISGTTENTLILQDIDAIAVQLKRFKSAGIPILWRPLHEAGGGWFWWGAKGATVCKQLYALLYNRLTGFHGLNNLIWQWSTPEADWYPGNSSVDMISYDSYPGAYNYDINKGVFDQLYTVTNGLKLIAMTENGPIPNPDDCFTYDAPWSYFMSWNELTTQQNSTQHLIDVYNNAKVITLENVGSYWIAKGKKTDADLTSATPDVESGNLKIYPNPAKSNVQLSGGEKASVIVSDLSGNTVYRSFEPVAGFTVVNIPDGVYVVKLVNSDRESTQKLIIKK